MSQKKKRRKMQKPGLGGGGRLYRRAKAQPLHFVSFASASWSSQTSLQIVVRIYALPSQTRENSHPYLPDDTSEHSLEHSLPMTSAVNPLAMWMNALNGIPGLSLQYAKFMGETRALIGAAEQWVWPSCSTKSTLYHTKSMRPCRSTQILPPGR